jgi:pimeloyl-ACP methyl ester carboxylesterase
MPFAGGMYYSISDERSKEKPVVVFIHGAGANHLCWPPGLRKLSGYRVIAVDLSGHGRSGGSGQQSIWMYADQLIGFLSELGLYRAVFIGHSMGGCISLAIALEHKDNVAGLGLISSGAHIDIPPEILTLAASPSTFTLAVDALKTKILGPNASAFLAERATHQLVETRPGVLYGDLLACKAFDVVSRLHEINSPSVVLCGSEDQWAPPHNSHYLAANLRCIGEDETSMISEKLVLSKSAGHMIMLEHPLEVKNTLVRFLNQVYRN